MGESSWWSEATACYHEPKVHDHELYFQLTNINLYVLLPLAVFGIFFNASALICLFRPPKITSGVFVYLAVLIILDISLCTISLCTSLLPQLCDNHHSKEHTFYKLCMFERRFLKYTLPRLESTVSILHIWTIASLSTHRYWKISRPVVSRFKDTVCRARTVLLVMFGALILFRLPIFLFELKIKWRPLIRINRRIESTELLSPYRITYHSILDPALSNLVPFFWMCLFSLLTLCEIIKSRHFGYSSIDSASSSIRRFSSGYSSETFKTFRKRADGGRAKQEFRATVSIIVIIALYLLLHSLQLYNVFRKWQLLLQKKCPTRSDYLQSHISNVLSMLSASVNAFVFIAFTSRIRRYVQMLIRKTSRSLSYQSSDPPLSPRTIISTDPVSPFSADNVLV
ncbi:hypothetical protein Ddc_01287 [Ditylenchus destructor]|nr:hypothetical protein Ddc_01287 [Ditylenchus destructor]